MKKELIKKNLNWSLFLIIIFGLYVAGNFVGTGWTPGTAIGKWLIGVILCGLSMFPIITIRNEIKKEIRNE